MAQALNSAFGRLIVLPMAAIAIAVLAKVTITMARRAPITRADFVVWVELIITAAVNLLTLAVEAAHDASLVSGAARSTYDNYIWKSFTLIFIFMLTLWPLSLLSATIDQWTHSLRIKGHAFTIPSGLVILHAAGLLTLLYSFWFSRSALP